MINKSNYEAFALDYLEGTLPAAEQQEMESFLQNHPAIAEEIKELKGMIILMPDETIVFENKSALLKTTSGVRIVAMHQRTWFRAVVAIAAMFLLIGGYFSGYFTGNISGLEEQVVNRQIDKPVETISTENVTFEKEQLVNQEVNENIEEDGFIKEVIHENKPTIPVPSPIVKTKRKYENVAISISKQKEEKTSTPIIIESNVIENQDDSAIAIDEMQIQNLGKEEQIKLLPKQQITIASLVTENIQLPSVSTSSNQEKNEIVIVDNKGFPNLSKLNEKSKKGKKTLKNIGRFLGNFPFEEATVAFIPTYYRDESK